MSSMPESARIRVWSEDVARDPSSLSFAPLALAYLEQGRTEAARRLCLRGLEQHPTHVEGHHLLGRVYHLEGDHVRAYDEWDIALRLDPEHAATRREMSRLPSPLPGASEPGRDAHRVRRFTAELDGLVDEFAREARVRLVLLVSGSGRVLAQRGFTRDMDVAAIASLGAGIHASSGALAEMLGEDGFAHLHQGAGDSHVFVGPFRTPGQQVILISVLGRESNAGLVQIRFGAFSDAAVRLSGWEHMRVTRRSQDFEQELNSGLERLFER